MNTTPAQRSPMRLRRWDVGNPPLRDLGEKCRLHYSTLARIERGKIKMQYHHAAQIAPHLQIDPVELLTKMARWYQEREAAAPRKRGRRAA